MGGDTTAVAANPQSRESFYARVYAFVRTIPRGRVITYGHVALALGSPPAARAVGYALHFLPAGSDVPWWRVINAKGEVSLRGRGTNADLQRALLEHEGVVFNAAGVCNLRDFRWWPGLDDAEIGPREGDAGQFG